MKLNDAILNYKSNHVQLHGKYLNNFILDYCNDSNENIRYAKLFCELNDKLNFEKIIPSKTRSFYRNLIQSTDLILSDADVEFLLSSLLILVDYMPVTSTINVLDFMLNNNDLYIAKGVENNISKNDDVTLIDGVLSGDPSDDYYLTLTNEKIKQGYISSINGGVKVDFINIGNMEISSCNGEINISGNETLIDELAINSINGDVIIDGVKINKLLINTSTGDVNINNSTINKINISSFLGDVNINVKGANSIDVETEGSKNIRNIM